MENVLKKRFLVPIIAAILVCDFFMAGTVALAESQVGVIGQATVSGQYPNGTLLRNSRGQVFVILNGYKHYISNLDELLWYQAGHTIIDVSDAVLMKYQDEPGVWLRIYADGSLLRNYKGQIFLITNGSKHHIVNMAELYLYVGKPIVNVPDSVLMAYSNLDVNFYPSGTLLKGSGPEIYMVVDSRKYHIKNLAELAIYGKHKATVKVSDEILARYENTLSAQSK